MRLNKLTLLNFRNYKELDLEFSPSINIFLGENAQGKTNLLESIYALALTRSFRTSKEKEMIQFGKNEAAVRGEVEKKNGMLPLEIYFSQKGRRVKLNHLPQKKLSSYFGQMKVILFSPEDLEIVKGSPNKRRKFMDMAISQMNPNYLYTLSAYQKTVKQRNQYFKKCRDDDQEVDLVYLDVLDGQVAGYGESLLKYRLAFVQKLSELAHREHGVISNGKDSLEIVYHSTVNGTFLEALRRNRERDIRRCRTSVGIHLDDLIFTINHLDASTYASQGQQRTVSLSLKLSEIELLSQATGETPILLLDDVMSELDNERQTYLLTLIQGKTQTFITTTTLKHLESLKVEAKTFEIKGGEVQAIHQSK